MRRGFGNAPPALGRGNGSGRGESVQNVQDKYFKSAREKNARLKGYFDDDDDEDEDGTNLQTTAAPSSNDDDYDPLDAFM
jgi:hypothetical protein